MGGRAGGGARGGGGYRDITGAPLGKAMKGSEFTPNEAQVMTNWKEFTSKKGVTPQYKTSYEVLIKRNPNMFGGVDTFRFDSKAQANAFIGHAQKKGYKFSGIGGKASF